MGRKGRPRKSGKREPNGRLVRIPERPTFERAWVYILKIEGQSLIKIGKAVDIENRLIGYRTHLPYEFYVLDRACFDTSAEAEQAERFLLRNLKGNPEGFIKGASFKHKVGEWFYAEFVDVFELTSQTLDRIPWEQPHKEMRA